MFVIWRYLHEIATLLRRHLKKYLSCWAGHSQGAKQHKTGIDDGAHVSVFQYGAELRTSSW